MTEQLQRRYQAIGTVEGVLVLAGADSTLTVSGTVFPAFVAGKAVPHVQSGELQFFRVYPDFTEEGHLAFKVIGVTPPPAMPLLIHGCWELDGDVPRMMIYRNEQHGFSDRRSRHALPVVWENAPTPDGKFWELEAEVRNGMFTVINAEGPLEPPPKVDIIQPEVPRSKASSKVSKVFARP
jgi:hypothetical protein